MSEYKISIVTPFHNVEMEVFKEAYESMTSQTIGFENVEWIIVVHNSEPQYLPALKQLVGDHRNVIVKPLDNEYHTPSAPRNYGMQFATAPYIGFLDADDSLTKICLEETVKAFEETQAQVVWFRREYQLEKQGLYPIADLVLWNQTYSRIIVDDDKKLREMIFSGVWGFVTSKIFDRQFLVDNNLHFDNTVGFGEDAFFTIDALAKAPRICLLPQLIGYHYFINSASLVQSGEKTPDTVVDYARGFQKSVQRMEELGLYTDYSIFVYLSMLLRYVVMIPGITSEHRRIIKECFGTYIERNSLPPTSKTVPQGEAQMVYNLANRIIMDPDSDITEYQRSLQDGVETLYGILKSNKDTDYGKHYCFSQLSKIADYQKNVPLTEYADYERLIRLQTNTGESGILTQNKTDRYVCKLSGKKIPLTEEHITPYNTAMDSLLKGHHNLWLNVSMTINQYTNDLAFADSLESVLVKDYFCSFYYAFGKKQAEFAVPMSQYFSEGDTPHYYTFMCYGIADREVDQIVDLTTNGIAKAFACLEAHWQEMVEEISRKDAARADELRAIFAEGFEGVAKRIWPNLERTIAFGVEKQHESTKAMKRYTQGVAHNHGYYMTAETMMARAMADDSEDFELLNNDFYEFLPVNSPSGTRPLLLSETKTNENYNVVITNKAGLYRYKSNHHIIIKEHLIGGKTIVTFSPDCD